MNELKERKEILICDDNDEILEVLRLTLISGGFAVRHAKNGESCIEKLKEKKPDLLITDIDMPKMDGFHLVENIKKEIDLSTVPVIVMSGLTEDSKRSEKQWAATLNVDVFFSKPFDPKKMLAQAKRLLKEK